MGFKSGNVCIVYSALKFIQLRSKHEEPLDCPRSDVIFPCCHDAAKVTRIKATVISNGTPNRQKG